MAHKFTEKELEGVDSGLENVYAAATIKSKVDGSLAGMLYYSGYNINDLVKNSNYEEIAFLLLNDGLPKKDELERLRKDITKDSKVPETAIEILKKAISDEPMAALRTAVSSLSIEDNNPSSLDEKELIKKSISLIARLPALVSAYYNLRNGKKIIAADPSLSIAGNFLYAIKGKKPSQEETRIMDTMLMIHADHDINASTFTARQVVSTLSDIYSAITAAMGSLKGPLHGGANEKAMDMIKEFDAKIKTDDDNKLRAEIRKIIGEKLAKKEVIMGIGHRVYKGGDPRARILRDMGQKYYPNNRFFKIASMIEDATIAEKGLRGNMDLYTGIVYGQLGIPHYLYTPIFGMARISGWCGHVIEQSVNNKLVRPKSKYIESLRPLNARYVPMGER